MIDRRSLFDTQPFVLATGYWTFFNVTQNDERFLMMRATSGDSAQTDATTFIYIQNFFEELKEKFGNE